MRSTVEGDSAQGINHLPHKHEEQSVDPNTHMKSGRCCDHHNPSFQEGDTGFPQGKLNS